MQLLSLVGRLGHHLEITLKEDMYLFSSCDTDSRYIQCSLVPRSERVWTEGVRNQSRLLATAASQTLGSSPR